VKNSKPLEAHKCQLIPDTPDSCGTSLPMARQCSSLPAFCTQVDIGSDGGVVLDDLYPFIRLLERFLCFYSHTQGCSSRRKDKKNQHTSQEKIGSTDRVLLQFSSF